MPASTGQRAAILLLALTFLLTACGDRIATRNLVITQIGMAASQWGTPIDFDTSQLPNTGIERTETRDSAGNPITHIQFSTDRPIKLLLVPAQP